MLGWIWKMFYIIQGVEQYTDRTLSQMSGAHWQTVYFCSLVWQQCDKSTSISLLKLVCLFPGHCVHNLVKERQKGAGGRGIDFTVL